MRYFSASLGLAALLGLGACNQSSSQAASDQTEAPKHSLAHQAQFYAGQEQVLKVDQASIELSKSGDAVLMKATGEEPGPGYTDPGFMKRIYAATPPDGIYEFDVVATKPAAPSAQAMTPITITGDWKAFPKDRLKGVKFISKGNEVVALLPAAKAGS
jgi:hypothetical protein